MSIDKEELFQVLMQIFYEYALKNDEEHAGDYYQGYRKGMLAIIEAVNQYSEKE